MSSVKSLHHFQNQLPDNFSLPLIKSPMHETETETLAETASECSHGKDVVTRDVTGVSLTSTRRRTRATHKSQATWGGRPAMSPRRCGPTTAYIADANLSCAHDVNIPPYTVLRETADSDKKAKNKAFLRGSIAKRSTRRLTESEQT